MCSVRIDRKMMLSSNLRKEVFSVSDKKKVLSQDRWEADVTLEHLTINFEPERWENWAQDRVWRLVVI